MNRQDQVELLITELGPAADFVNAVERLDENSWGVACADESIGVKIDFEPDNEVLTLLTELGSVAEQNRLATYETMLMYNAIGQQTGGIRMGIADQQGTAVQELDLATEGLELNYLTARLQDFVLKAALWISIIERGGVSDTNDGQNAVSQLQTDSASVIRV